MSCTPREEAQEVRFGQVWEDTRNIGRWLSVIYIDASRALMIKCHPGGIPMQRGGICWVSLSALREGKRYKFVRGAALTAEQTEFAGTKLALASAQQGCATAKAERDAAQELARKLSDTNDKLDAENQRLRDAVDAR